MRSSVLLCFLAFLCAGCGPDVDLTKALQVEVVSTGWFDAGIVNGQNKLVPSITNWTVRLSPGCSVIFWKSFSSCTGRTSEATLSRR